MEPEVWTLAGALDEITTIHQRMTERTFVFVLGAGASATSGIPPGGRLAEMWLRELHARNNHDNLSFLEWVDSGKTGIKDLKSDSIAGFYPQIFERRFRGDRESGYACLEAAMENSSPSIGYSLLAEVLQSTRHKVVVTTNFDNLVADAMAMHAQKTPLVVGHEALTGFVRPKHRRPLVAKIHRDLFYAPINDVDGTSKLSVGWHDALKKLFQYHTPIVIGYAGNDGSLMDFLQELNADAISGRMLWTFRRGSGANPRVKSVVEKHGGVLVPIPGFDELMLLLAPRLLVDFDLSRISERLEALGQRRAAKYREQAEDLRRRTESATASTRPGHSEDAEAAQRVLAFAFKDEKNWWTWQVRAAAEADEEKRLAIYEEGMRVIPSNARLIAAYADSLRALERIPQADEQYRNAISLSSDDVAIQREYAYFLSDWCDDLTGAERIYKAAIARAPSDVPTLHAYANFVANKLRSCDAATALFERALQLDSNTPEVMHDYAKLLAVSGNTKRAEEMFKRAMTADPRHAATIGNYAYFLDKFGEQYDKAEEFYRRAIGIDNTIPFNLVNYGVLLLRRRGDVDEAEVLFKEALRHSPGHSTYAGSYVALLLAYRKDVGEADRVLSAALRQEPRSPNNAANLAAVRVCQEAFPEARDVARAAIALARNSPYQEVAEALFYEALASVALGKPDGAALGRLKKLLEVGFERAFWDFSPMMDAALKSAQDRRGYYEALAAAILDKKKLQELDNWDDWKSVDCIDPFLPLPAT